MDPLLTKAYGLYLEETSKHLEFFKKLQEHASLSKEEWEEGRVFAHRVKGGAGFFGLTKFGEVAKRLEDLFRENSYKGSYTSELREIVSALEAELKNCPSAT